MPTFTEENIRVRRSITQAGRRRRRRRKAPKPPVWLHPIGVERKYTAILLAFVKHIQEAVNTILMPIGPELVRQADADTPQVDSRMDAIDKATELLNSYGMTYNLDVIDIKAQFTGTLTTDSWVNELDSTMGDVNSWLDRNPGISDPRSVALGVALETSNFNQQQWRKIVKAVLQVDLFKSEPWLLTKVEAFVFENVALIKSIQNQSLARIEQQVILGIQRGDRWERIRDMIKKEYGRSENRARLIARDQVGKLNGDLTHARQVDIGVTHYVWRTSLDERVRGNPFKNPVPQGQNHWDRENEMFPWAEPPPDGHPGFPIQCRCYAEPAMNDLYNKTRP